MENNNKGIGSWTFRILYKHYIDKFIACKTQQKCFYNEGQFLTSLMLVALYNVSFRDHLVLYNTTNLKPIILLIRSTLKS